MLQALRVEPCVFKGLQNGPLFANWDMVSFKAERVCVKSRLRCCRLALLLTTLWSLALFGCAEERSESDNAAGASEAADRFTGEESTAAGWADPMVDEGVEGGVNTPDAGAVGQDISVDNDGGPAEAPPEPGKADDGFLVPPNVAARQQVVVSGGLVAWVERSVESNETVLMVWEALAGKEPQALRAPNLSNPRQLVLADNWLVYVDDRYGDDDIFAIDLATGLEQPVVTEAGAQVEPDLKGDVVVWRDCRSCVDGADSAAEIFRADLSGDEPAKQITSSAADDRRPALGTASDGGELIAWIEGERRIRVRSELSDEVWEVGEFVSTIALSGGYVTWRESTGLINPDSMMPIAINPDSMKPAVGINPDSMIPSDVYATDVQSGDTHALSVHAELSPELLGRVHAAHGRAVWLEANPAAALAPRLVVADIAAGKELASIEIPGLWAPSLGAEMVAFIAPREDNAGLDDVWVLPLDPMSP